MKRAREEGERNYFVGVVETVCANDEDNHVEFATGSRLVVDYYVMAIFFVLMICPCRSVDSRTD